MSEEFLDIQATIESRFTLKRVLDMIITHSHSLLWISNFVFASTEKVFVHRKKGKFVLAWQRECLWCAFPKIVVVGKRLIPYDLCAYEHVFEGISGNTLLFCTGTSLYCAFIRDKIHFACGKNLLPYYYQLQSWPLIVIVFVSTNWFTVYKPQDLSLKFLS